MERKIKFKAKAVSDGRWVYGDLLHTDDDNVCFIVNPDRDDVSFTFVARSIEVDPKTICQATGICDKDGHEIYENDHLLTTDTKVIFELRWNQDYCCYSLYDLATGQCAAKNVTKYYTNRIKVVGNKFDKR